MIQGRGAVDADLAGIVFARQGRFLAAAFHPELTGDLRIHEYFLEKCVHINIVNKGAE